MYSLKSGHPKNISQVLVGSQSDFNSLLGLGAYWGEDMNKIPISGRDGIGKFTIVDDDTYEWASKHKWYLHHKGYLRAHLPGYNKLVLHQKVLGKKEGFVSDHINGDKLDNRQSNLRFATIEENAQNRKTPINNTSGFTGVSFYKRNKKWGVCIRHKRSSYFLGLFEDILEAALVRDAAALGAYGEFARLNSST